VKRPPSHIVIHYCVSLLSVTTFFYRAINILPNRFLGVIGEHKFDVESLALSHDQQLLVSCSHDHCVKFWDVCSVKREKFDAHKKAKGTNKTKKLGTAKQKDFFAGLADDDGKEEGEENDDGDDDSDDDDDDSDDSDDSD
jgi:WD40 repeat protein